MTEKCPKCKSTELRKYGTKIVSGGIKKQKFQCTDCGHVFTGAEEIKTEEST